MGGTYSLFRMNHVRCLESLVVLIAVASVAAAQGPRPKLPDGIKVHADLEYVPGGHARQRLDLYVPAKAGTTLPVIVWIHGGAWMGGSKDGGVVALPLVGKGYAVASINYRLSQHAVFPAQIEDCKAAIHWLRSNAKKYNLDPERIGVWGASAGGHLVALLGTTGGAQDLEGKGGHADESSRVQAVVDFFGPTDFLQMDAHAVTGARLKHDSPASPESRLIGGAIQENVEKVGRANPIKYVTKEAPPFLIVHGEQDPLVPCHQSELLYQALKQARCDVTFYKIAGAGHGSPEFNTGMMQAAVQAFFDKHLKEDKKQDVSPKAESDRRSLKEAVGDRFKIGVGVSHIVLQQPEDAALVRQHFHIITPENCMKPQSIHPAEDKWDFEAADHFVAFARANKLEVVGHCLVWAKDDRTDEWMKQENGKPVSRETLLRRIETHIETVVGRYADVATMWDVVNEAIGDGNEGLLRDSVYSRTTGIDFIVTAFKAARAKDPDALLIYNDYNGHKPGKREKLLELLAQLKQKGAPVDAYGMQGHFELGDDSIPQLRETFDELRKLGIKVVVSELDIDVVTRSRWWADNGKHRDELAKYDPYKDGVPAEIEQKQIDQYVKLFKLFDEYSDMIERVSFWNLHDGQSWLNYFPWNRVNYPLLFDRNRRPKPAFDAVYAALRTRRSVHAPLERRDPNSRAAHQQLIAKTKPGKIDIYFEGDSITRRWGATDYPKLLAHWEKHFHGWNAANFGWGGDTTHNILWRLQNGELDGVSPKIIVLQAGTNNLPGRGPADAAAVDDIVVGVKAIIATFHKQAPDAAIVLTALFPRPQNKALAPTIKRINEQLATLADGKSIRLLNINDQLTDDKGDLLPGVSRDGLHLEEKGYDVWAAALRPIFTELLGPPAEMDRAPPPTGDPSAGRRSAPSATP